MLPQPLPEAGLSCKVAWQNVSAPQHKQANCAAALQLLAGGDQTHSVLCPCVPLFVLATWLLWLCSASLLSSGLRLRLVTLNLEPKCEK